MKPCGFRGRVTQGSISTERTARRGQTAPFPLAQGIRTRRKTARRKSDAVTWQDAFVFRLRAPRGKNAQQSSRGKLEAIRRIGLFCGSLSRTGQGPLPHGLFAAACSAVFLVHRTGKRAGAALSAALFCTNGQAVRLRLLFSSFSLRKEKEQRLSPFGKGETVFFSPEREKDGKIYRDSRLGLPAAGWEPYPHGSRHDGLTRFARSPRPKPKNHLYPFEARPYYQLYPDTMLRIAGQTRRAGAVCGWKLPRLWARGDFAVFAHESGAFDKKFPLPKTRKALLLGGLSLIQNITIL